MLPIGENEKVISLLEKYGQDILNSDTFKLERNFIQHGTISCYEHSMAVAYISIVIALKYNVKNINLKSLVRGALLHDYFLYDWHEKNAGHGLHGYFHAAISLRNARRDFQINKIEENIIFRHMFPLNITRIPNCKEAAIVCLADKFCALCETLTISSYSTSLFIA